MLRYTRLFISLMILAIAVAGAWLYNNNSEFNGVVDARLTSSCNKFAFRLIGPVTASSPGNVVISPAGIYDSLCMVYSGAEGDTKKAIASPLGIGSLYPMEVAGACTMLRESILRPGVSVSTGVGTALWVDKQREIKQTFVVDCKDDYDTDITYIDKGRKEWTRSPNQWISRITRGKVDETAVANGTTPNQCVVSNAVYYRGEWQTPFTVANTRTADFKCADGVTKQTPMMNATLNARYVSTQGVQIIAIPYAGRRMIMYVMLPSKDIDLIQMLSFMNIQQWNDIVSKMAVHTVAVTLPKYRVRSEISLRKPLCKLGLSPLFDADVDLSNMASPGLSIADVMHTAEIEVDENRTNVASSDADSRVKDVDNPPIPFVVNRPFFYVIRDIKTGSTLLMGVITNPQ